MLAGRAGHEIVIVAAAGNRVDDVAQSSLRSQVERRAVDAGQLSGWNLFGIDGRVPVGVELDAVIIQLLAASLVPGQIEIGVVNEIDGCWQIS